MLQNKEEVKGNDGPNVIMPQIEKNERITNEIDMMLKEAYVMGNYTKALGLLQSGASGSVYLDSNVPLLYDLYKNYEQGLEGTDLLFAYYLRNRKNCFKDFLDGIYPDQTVGSYIAHFGSLDLLQKIADEKIPINSEKEIPEDTALFDIVAAEWTYNMANQTFGGLKYNEKEKRKRIKLLLETGADVALLRTYDGGTIFHSFRWYPEEEDFTDVLDKMIELGASPQVLNNDGHSAIYDTLDRDALISNSEKYIAYLLAHGVEPTPNDSYLLDTYATRVRRSEASEDEKAKWSQDQEIQGRLNRLRSLLGESE